MIILIIKRSISKHYQIVHFSARAKNMSTSQNVDRISYIRKGNPITVIFYAFCFYVKNKKRISIVVNQCNTHQFFTPLWVPQQKRLFMIHQLTREIWKINFPIILGHIGKLLETPMLRINRNDPVLSVSKSTEKDLCEIGFNKDKIQIIPEGIHFSHWKPENFKEKEEKVTFIYVGRYSVYKGLLASLQAFCQFKKSHPESQFWIVGKRNEKFINEYIKPLARKERLYISEK